MSLKRTVAGSQNEAWYGLPSTADGMVTGLKIKGDGVGDGVGVGVGDVGDVAPPHEIAKTIKTQPISPTKTLLFIRHSSLKPQPKLCLITSEHLSYQRRSIEKWQPSRIRQRLDKQCEDYPAQALRNPTCDL